MSGHTEGPWQVHWEANVVGYPVYSIHGMSGDQKRDEATLNANARLIAQAPALLALVERCLPFVKMRANRFEGDGVIDRVQDLAAVLEHDIRQVLAAVREGEK